VRPEQDAGPRRDQGGSGGREAAPADCAGAREARVLCVGLPGSHGVRGRAERDPGEQNAPPRRRQRRAHRAPRREGESRGVGTAPHPYPYPYPHPPIPILILIPYSPSLSSFPCRPPGSTPTGAGSRRCRGARCRTQRGISRIVIVAVRRPAVTVAAHALDRRAPRTVPLRPRTRSLRTSCGRALPVRTVLARGGAAQRPAVPPRNRRERSSRSGVVKGGGSRARTSPGLCPPQGGPPQRGLRPPLGGSPRPARSKPLSWPGIGTESCIGRCSAARGRGRGLRPGGSPRFLRPRPPAAEEGVPFPLTA
jgi:hypothetical protein